MANEQDRLAQLIDHHLKLLIGDLTARLAIALAANDTLREEVAALKQTGVK